MLEVIHLSKKYGKTLAADDIGFTVPDGRIGILLGPNGAGKSTVIKSIAGLLRFKGTIRIQGQDSHTMEAKRSFAYVPELPYMYEALTVREHLEFISRAYGIPLSEEEAASLLRRFELDDKQDKLGSELSKGMMQKVSICCALFNSQILELKDQGATVLISTHMLEMVKELWDVTFVMDKGHILGTYAREALANEDLEDLYFSVTGQDRTREDGRQTWEQ